MESKLQVASSRLYQDLILLQKIPASTLPSTSKQFILLLFWSRLANMVPTK